MSRRWLTGHGQPAVQRIRFRRRRTYDSGATPTMDTAARPPATLASIDLAAIAAQMAEVAEQAEQKDPVALRRRIAGLEQRLRATPGPHMEEENRVLRAQLREAQARPPERVEVPVLTDADRKALAGTREALAGAVDVLRVIDGKLTTAGPPSPAPAAPEPAAPEPAAAKPPPRASRRPARPRPVMVVPDLPAGAARMLAALARMHPVKLTRAQLASLARMKRSSGTFSTYLSLLRTKGLMTEDDGLLSMTAEGLSSCGMAGRRPVTGPEVLDMWRAALPGGCRVMFDLLLAAAPDPLTRAELAEGAHLDAGSGTFGTYLSTLRANGLAVVNSDRVRASGEILSAARPRRGRKTGGHR